MDRPVLIYIETPGGRRIRNNRLIVSIMLFKARNPTCRGVYLPIAERFRADIRTSGGKYPHIGANLDIRIFIGEWEIVNVKPAE